MKTSAFQKKVQALLNSTCSDPCDLLGMRIVPIEGTRGSLTVRALLPGVNEAYVHDSKTQKRYPMTRIHDAGLFEKTFTNRKKPFAYELEALNGHSEARRFADPYSFPSLLSADALAAFTSGAAYDIYDSLGCHLRDVNGVAGALFAVWAPNAKGVSVVGDFNDWNGQRHPMRRLKKWGVWELFLPGVKAGERYQYQIVTAQGETIQKSDPYGFAFEQPPSNKTIVAALRHFQWTDENWLEQRKQYTPLKSPISTYEAHLGSWMKHAGENNRFLTYRELADTLIPYVKQLGFTHIELLPVAEHPFYASWGYQVTGYYAPTSRYGTPDDFMYFVNECHRAGIGVLIDWVPAHFPRDSFALGEFDGTNLYEHADPHMGEHKDWGTLIFDYGRNEVKNFLIANALFWLNTYHIDGIRVDAVASMLYLDYSRKEGEWTPNKYGGRENLEAIDCIKELNLAIHRQFPGVMTLAEESTSWLGVTYPAYIGGLNFTFKWNLGWMNDTLHYLSHDPVFRKFVHTMVPFALLYAFHEHFVLELSHDEVVHGKGSLLNKMPGDDASKFANLRLLYGFMFGHPGKKLLFMGAEFGQWREWDHDSSLEWHLLQYAPHQGLQRFVRDSNHLYLTEPALYLDDTEERCFEWIDYHDFERSIFSFMRKAYNHGQHTVICIYNFTPVARHEYRLGVPYSGYYQEILNSDAAEYDGSGLRNHFCHAEPIPWHQQPYSITLTLPPLSAIMLKPVGECAPEDLVIATKTAMPVGAIDTAADTQSAPPASTIKYAAWPDELNQQAPQTAAEDMRVNERDTSAQPAFATSQTILPPAAYLGDETPDAPESRPARPQGSKEQHLPSTKKSRSKRSSG